MLREIEANKPELLTGRAHGLVFTPTGHRLALLTEDEDELALWNVAERRQLTKLPLRGGAGLLPQAVAPSAPLESATAGRSDLAGTGGGSAAAAIRPGPGGGPGGPPGRSNLLGPPRQRIAQVGPYIATVLPDDRGLGIVDLLSGSPLRVLDRPDRTILGVLGESTGHRLVTIETDSADKPRGPEVPFRDFYVYLWDADNLVQPIASLPCPVGPGRGGGFPLVALSPDGRTVAVAPPRGMLVKLFSARDGTPLKRRVRPGPGQNRDSTAEDLEIEPQADLSALALGPNNSLATAGNTAGGVAIRIWNLDSPSSQTSLNPPAQNYTRLMRFSPQGNLLAIVGSGPIELWDRVALNLVAVLGMAEEATDVAFAPDGKTLAAVSRAGVSIIWTIHDSAARTQLSGFETPLATLAYSDDGLLAGVGWNGETWTWRSGRCPEIGPPPLGPSGSAASVLPSVANTEAPQRSEGSGSEGRRKGRTKGREGRRGPPPSFAFDDSGRMVFHDPQGVRVYHAGSIPADGFPEYRIATPEVPGFGFGRMPDLCGTPNGKIIALGRSNNIYLWCAESPGQLISVELPARYSYTSEPAKNAARRQSSASVESQPPLFRAIQIAPGGEKLYTIEQSQGSASVLRVWELGAIAQVRLSTPASSKPPRFPTA